MRAQINPYILYTANPHPSRQFQPITKSLPNQSDDADDERDYTDHGGCCSRSERKKSCSAESMSFSLFFREEKAALADYFVCLLGEREAFCLGRRAVVFQYEIRLLEKRAPRVLQVVYSFFAPADHFHFSYPALDLFMRYFLPERAAIIQQT